jgi:hypothetical protein
MPAPASVQVQTQLKAALLARGFVKRSYVNGAVVSDPTSLPDSLQRLVDALGNGDSAWFAQWQQAQQVLIPSTGGEGSPSTGTLP